MARRDDYTEMGGPTPRFQTTRWTELMDGRTDDPQRRREALAAVATRYWKPIYCYLRRKGRSNDEAKDLTQGFLAEVVLGRDLVGRADPGKGRFRTFLLTALDRYVISQHRLQSGKRRAPDGGLARLEPADWDNVPEGRPDLTPDKEYVYEWAKSLIRNVLADVEADCRQTGKEVHWEVFHARLPGPILGAEAVPSLEELCQRHGIASVKQAANLLVTVKRRFQAILREHVRQSVAEDADIDSEIRDLMRILHE